MPPSFKNSRTFRWLIKLLKFFAIFSIIVVLLVSLILIFLPTAVSTPTSKQFIENQLSNTLARSVRIDHLNWSWKDGIVLNKLSIPDSPDFSENPMVSLYHAKLKLNVKQLLHREVNLELIVSDLDVNIIKNSSGKLNVEMLGKKEPFVEKPPVPSEKKDKKEKKPFVLPPSIIDISVKIGLNSINFFYNDQEKTKTYIVKDLDIKLEAPSLKTSPVDLTIGFDVQVNEQAISRSFLTASVKNLFNADGALNIGGLIAGLDAQLPGISASVDADMASSKIKSKIQIDLASVKQVAVPLVPDFPSPTDIKGSIELTAATGARPEKPLAFDAMLTVSDLEVSGKVIDGKSIGPGNFSVYLNGIMDLNAERLDLVTGEIHILENSRIHTSGRVEQIKQDDKKIHLAVSPLYLDINELTSFARPFIPPYVEIYNQEKQAAISLKELRIDGLIPKGHADVLLDELKINLPAVVLKDKTDKKSILQVSGARVILESLSAALTDLFPESAALKLSLAVDELINGKSPNEIKISNIRLNQLNAAADNLTKTESSKFSISSNLSLENKLKIEQIQLPDLLQINDLEQSIKINASLRPNETISGKLDHLDVTSKKISVLKKDIGPINLDTRINIHLAFDEIFLKNLDPVNADIKNFIARMTAEDAVSIALDANAVDLANTSFNTDIKIDSDLDALTNKLPEKLLPGISSSGNLNISLNAAGRRPGNNEIDALKNKQLTDNLEFIDRLNVNINLDQGAVAISLPDQNPISVEFITANPMLSYELSGKTGKGNIISLIKIDSVKGLPGISTDTPVSGKFSVSANHEYVKTIDLNQTLSVAPAGIDESIHITIDGLDRMITQSPLPELSQWISKVGVAISANVKIPDCSALKKMGLPGLSETDLNGLLAAGVSFALIPDQSVDGSISLTINGMNFTMPETVSVENIDANIDFSKAYLVQSAEKALPISAATGLSLNVIEPAGQYAMAGQNLDIYRHIRLLHERMNPAPALSFQKADVMSAPFPLIIDESMVMLNLDNGLPNLDYFQFNLLGGTINGSIALLNKQGQVKNPFNVNTALTFSGINTAQIFPGAFSKDDYSKANISGSLYADIPVTDQLQTILENMAFTVEFTRIGSRALERMLYALDPYESNEAIVSQRLLLKNGSPKKIRLDIKDGFLSLRGKVSIKGIEISMPAIRRLNIALIPGIDRFEDSLAGLLPAIGILHKISAEHIVINKQANTIAFE